MELKEQQNAEIEKERNDLLARLADLGDITVKPATIRPELDNTVTFLRNKLRTESGINFDMVVIALRRCGLELPYKAPVYAIVAGILTSDSAGFATPLAKSVVDYVARKFSTALREGRASHASRALRYLACLTSTGVVATSSFAKYITMLLDTALKEITTNLSNNGRVHARGQYFAEIALSVLPWAASSLRDKTPDELHAIVETANEIFEAWLPNKWRSLSNSSSGLSEECFVGWKKAVSALKTLEWNVSTDLIPNFAAEFESELTDAQQLELPPFTIAAHSKKAKYAAPRHILHLINESKNDADMTDKPADGEDTEKVKSENDMDTGNEADKTNGNGTKEGDETMNGPNESKESENAVAHVVKLAYIRDVLDNFSTSHKMAAERLSKMPMMADSNNLIVEGLFSELCSLPMSTFQTVYYGILFVDLCKEFKDPRLPVKLLSAVEVMFQQSDELDPETFDRLTSWLAFHLSNFGYRFNWTEWMVYADVDMEEKFPFRALFIRDVLKRCISLAFHDHIAQLIPEEMSYFLPVKPDDGNKQRFDGEITDQLFAIVTGSGKQPISVVRKKLHTLFPPSEIEDVQKRDEENSRQNLKRLAALLRAILRAGFKTLSHFDTVAIRYLELLHEMTALGGMEAKQLTILEICTFWESSHMRRLYSLDKLSMNGVIDGPSVLQFIMSPYYEQDNGEKTEKSDDMLIKELNDSNTWEFVRLVLDRSTAREEGARLELTTASQLAASATEGDMEVLEARLERAKAGAAKSKEVMKLCLRIVVKRCYEICTKLLNAGNDVMTDGKPDDLDDDDALPGFNGAPVWMWRCLGMVRECSRKYPRYMSEMLDELKEAADEGCQKHEVLQKSMTALEEVARSDISPLVH